MGQKHICHRSSELRAEIRKVRSIEPEAYRLALRARESIRLDQFNREQDITIGNYTYTIPYARQTACCEHHLKIGSPLVVISTNDYWDLFEKISRSPAQMLRNALRNSNETVFVAAEAVEPECRCVPFLFVCKESNVEKVRQRVVPLSDALGFEGAIAHAVDVTCSKCGARTPWHNSVFCHLCQATVWCSTRCKEQDITDHETACKEEITCAERILHSSQSETYWPFVLGLSGFPQNVLPFKCAIQLPLLPSLLLQNLCIRDARTLVQNNILVHRMYELDLEKRRRRAEETAEANAAQLMEQEESARNQRERRKKKKCRKKAPVFERAPPEMLPPHTTPPLDDEDVLVSGSTTDTTARPAMDNSHITPLEQDGPAIELTCPITHSIMTDPVVVASGHTFERDAIQAWFLRSNTNPLTGETLPHTHLIQNVTVRALCQDYIKLSL